MSLALSRKDSNVCIGPYLLNSIIKEYIEKKKWYFKVRVICERNVPKVFVYTHIQHCKASYACSSLKLAIWTLRLFSLRINDIVDINLIVINWSNTRMFMVQHVPVTFSYITSPFVDLSFAIHPLDNVWNQWSS